jgi:hypothetical protein
MRTRSTRRLIERELGSFLPPDPKRPRQDASTAAD